MYHRLFVFLVDNYQMLILASQDIMGKVAASQMLDFLHHSYVITGCLQLLWYVKQLINQLSNPRTYLCSHLKWEQTPSATIRPGKMYKNILKYSRNLNDQTNNTMHIGHTQICCASWHYLWSINDNSWSKSAAKQWPLLWDFSSKPTGKRDIRLNLILQQ